MILRTQTAASIDSLLAKANAAVATALQAHEDVATIAAERSESHLQAAALHTSEANRHNNIQQTALGTIEMLRKA